MPSSASRGGCLERRSLPISPELLLLVAVLGVIGSLVAIAPTPPNDLWWHLKVGEVIAWEGALPQANRFAWSVPADVPYFYGAWLGELLMYLVYRVGQVELLAFARNVLGLTALGLVALEARRRVGSWRFAGLAVGLAGALALNNVTIRTQMWAWVPFGVFLVVLGNYADGRLPARWLLALPLTMAFWVNVHGSFVLGLFLAGAYLVGEAIRQRHLFGQEGARLRWLALATVGCGLATLVNPRGPGIVTYVLGLLGNSPSQALMTDWQPPTVGTPLNAFFFATVLALLVLFALARWSPTPTDLILTCGLLWLAWSGQRYVMWYGFAIMPLLVGVLARVHPRADADGPAPGSRLASMGVIMALTIFLWVAVQPWFVQSVPLPTQYRDRMLPPPAPPLLTLDTPVAAAGYLAANPGGRLFNEFGYGSYLIWALDGQAVFIDPRVELYPTQVWLDYLAISNGSQAVELLARYGADRVILDRELQSRLARALAESGVWEREYADQRAEIWRRMPL